LKSRRAASAVLILIAAGLAACELPGANWPGLDSDLTAAVDGLLAAFLTDPASGGRVYCTSQTLAVEQIGDAIKARVWAQCEALYPVYGVLQVGAGCSGPLMVYLFSNEEDYLPGLSWVMNMTTGFSFPRDGSLLTEDIERFFPPAATGRMCLEDAGCSNARTEHLEKALVQKVRTRSPLPIATHSAR
jgi:hypothetical protein